ncbi:hypothetical protein QBC46DRAFT_418605 [Diplogelasinospora grovesii]|uniref:GPI inositol-deacylase n=1 Tax=Diplogelasinospora grovesii TaxID=303347 RepID=A0AAN6N092_9PEZI|nr:hypothetical protein QBC46DRAFT_418605 [Diplogelasinospora grovesii]
MSLRAFRPKNKSVDNPADNTSTRKNTSSSGSFSRSNTLVDDGGADPKGTLGLCLLHAPSYPLLDFIFVHGLGGGSRKTWSKTESISDYWPGEWLPKDPAFKDDKENCLNIHHMGKSLLAEMATSPYISDSDTSLVLIGHSMGGLVIKKAYMLARQDPAFGSLADRVYAIYFLATPHRGSDSAKLLKNILWAASSSRAYVADLVRSSGTLQSINDEFRHYSADVELCSFYETLSLSALGGSIMIVDPESATLGYPREKQFPMTADHRSICKFDSPSDPNYRAIRNALAKTVGDATSKSSKTTHFLQRGSLEVLAEFLGVNGKPEDDLFLVQDARMEGTCEWLSSKKSYLDWKTQATTSTLLWIDGKPAAGKSVLAGFIVDDLVESQIPCSYFFFKHGDSAKSRLGACLRSLAFQMACIDAGVRNKLLELREKQAKIDLDNERVIWRTLFVSGIFQAMSCHYWVIDPLDECSNCGPFFDSMLAKMGQTTPLRILMTSRETSELHKAFSSLGNHRCHREAIVAEETLADIELIVSTKAQKLDLGSEEDRSALVSTVIEKAKGSFLWTTLVLDELSSAYSEEDIEQILDEVPQGMEPLYDRALEMMSRATRGKRLAKAILTWAVCVIRPLTVRELQAALEIDLKDRFLRLGESVATLCGQLVTTDKFGRVQMVHETAREFLLNDDLDSDLAINKSEAHTRIARTCLEYLNSDDMKPPRTMRRNTDAPRCAKKSEFSTLSVADPLADDVLALLYKFLRSNVLSWIEYAARSKSLSLVVRAARHLKSYLDACMVERSPLRTDLQAIRGWSTDLQRIAAKFSDALIASPSAIHSLIVPFCPTESAIRQTEAAGRKLSIMGLPNIQWDDRLSCIDYRKGQAGALSYGEDFFAVGLTGGAIVLYHSNSCQEYLRLNHGETVHHLQFKAKSDLMASSGQRKLRVWDTRSGQLLHTMQAPKQCIGLAFDGGLLVAASGRNELLSWDLDADATKLPSRLWSTSCDDQSAKTAASGQPCALSISVSHKMLAVAYSMKPIMLWDLEEDAYFGTCAMKLADGQPSVHPLTALVFNPHPNIPLLAASCLDGQLAIIDPFHDQQLEKQRHNCHTLAASPDGRLLAGGAGAGTIHIFEFETLRLLYRVKSSNFWIKSLAFSADGLNLADLRGAQCNIWKPPVLLADSMDDDSSVGTSNTFVDAPSSESNARMTAMALMMDDGGAVICGKDDGSVCLYNINTGDQIRELYAHQRTVRTVAWSNERQTVISIGDSNDIFACSLEKSSATKGEWAVKSRVSQSRLTTCEDHIIYLLPAEDMGKCILSTPSSDFLWNFADGSCEQAKNYPGPRHTRVWLQHPQSRSHVICIEPEMARVFSWEDWSELTSTTFGVDLAGLQLKSAYRSAEGQIALELKALDGSAETKSVYQIDCTYLPIENTLASPSVEATEASAPSEHSHNPRASPSTWVMMPLSGVVSDRIAHVMGMQAPNKLVFLDTSSWVCSIELGEQPQDSHHPSSYTRHFFVPYDWFAGIKGLVCGINQHDVLIARNDNVAIIKNGLEFMEKITVETNTAVLDKSLVLTVPSLQTTNTIQMAGRPGSSR